MNLGGWSWILGAIVAAIAMMIEHGQSITADDIYFALAIFCCFMALDRFLQRAPKCRGIKE